MADARSLTVRDSTGAAVTVGVTLVEYRDRAGAARTPPAITHVGAGKWVFVPTDDDETTGTVALVDCGANNLPRRGSVAIHLSDNSNQFWAVHVENPDGTLWAGAAPTVGQYVEADGDARTPPSVVAVAGAYLYAVTPSAADLAAGVEGRIDLPAGASGAYFDISTIGSSPWAAPSPGALKDAAYDVAQFLNGKTAGATLLTLGTNLFIGPMRDADRAPAGPAVFVLNTGGASPASMLSGERQALFRPSVQVMVRGAADAFAAGEQLARGLHAWLHLHVLAGYVTWYVVDSQPAFLGHDGDQHPLWSLNLEATYAAALG
jgi:hypothetical protein